MNEQKEPSAGRRDFMKAAIFGIGGLIGAIVGLPAIAYVVGPALSKASDVWIRLGVTTKVEKDNPTLFKTTVETQTGWISSQEEVSAYVLTEDGQNYTVLSNVCTHLGCRVRWIAEDGKFHCPCHNGVFAKDGTVVSGPPPRPLDHFDSRVQDGILYIKRG